MKIKQENKWEKTRSRGCGRWRCAAGRWRWRCRPHLGAAKACRPWWPWAGWVEGAGLVCCLVENTRGLCRCRGRCRVHGGCLGCDGGTVVPLLDDVDLGAVPMPGGYPGALGLPRLMAQYHSRFSWARICYLVDVDPGAVPLPGAGRARWGCLGWWRSTIPDFCGRGSATYWSLT
jgi:hypothetical protein